MKRQDRSFGDPDLVVVDALVLEGPSTASIRMQ